MSGRIYLKTNRFEGGACLSLLEYGKLLKRLGYTVTAGGDDGRNRENYSAEGITTEIQPQLEWKNPIGNFINIMRFCRSVMRCRSDVIVTIAFNNCIFCKVVTKITNIPVINIVPGGELPTYFSRVMGNSRIIVFSDENARSLNNQGYDTSKVSVISNRFSTSRSIRSDNLLERPLRLLLVSRIESYKMYSINAGLSLVERANQSGRKIDLDIIGDGSKREELQHSIDEINRCLGRQAISIKGYQSDPIAFSREYAITLGMGRSVLDSILLSRIGIVAGADGRLHLCTPENFLKLSTSNFTGRSVTDDTPIEETLALVDTLLKGEFPPWADRTSQIAHTAYHIDSATGKIVEQISVVKSETNICRFPLNFIKATAVYIKLYYIRLSESLLSR